jgi:hypothetical protein
MKDERSTAATDQLYRPEALLIAAAALLPFLLLASSLRSRGTTKAKSGSQGWAHARAIKNAVPLMGRSPSLPPSSAPPKPVNLSGCWLNTEIRGDFRAYMVAMGAPFLVRAAPRPRAGLVIACEGSTCFLYMFITPF